MVAASRSRVSSISRSRDRCARSATACSSSGPGVSCGRLPMSRASGSKVPRLPGATARMSPRHVPPACSPGDTAPDFTLPDRHRRGRHPVGPARPQGHRLLLPGRDDPGLHHAGLRLHATRSTRCGRRATRCSASPPTSRRSWRKFREQDGLTHHAAVRRRPVGDDGLRRVRREEALRQDRAGRHPLHLRRRRGRARSSSPSTTSRRPATSRSSAGTSGSRPDPDRPLAPRTRRAPVAQRQRHARS